MKLVGRGRDRGSVEEMKDRRCTKCDIETNNKFCGECGRETKRIDTLCPSGGSGESQQEYFGITKKNR